MKDQVIFATMQSADASFVHEKPQQKNHLENLTDLRDDRKKYFPNSNTADESDNVSSLNDLNEEIMKKFDDAESVEDWARLRSELKIKKSNENIRKVLMYIKEKTDKMTEEDKKNYIRAATVGAFKDVFPDFLIDVVIAQFFPGDSEISIDTRPEWLDIDKFRRGQKFALNNVFSIGYADILSLVAVFSFEDGLKPLIVTGASSTPYTAFKRYYSTQLRIRNWYMSDPWTPGTPAYNDVKTVRKMHACVRRRLEKMTPEEIAEKAEIKEPWCPSLKNLREDFLSTCPAPAPGQCPYTALSQYPELKFHHLNQGEMVATQFAFIGLIATYPKFFGLHDATEEDIEAFVHLWRGIGYLLGIDDEFNFCRGTLEDIRIRTKSILEYWVKPNFRVVTPEWEHMMRCIIEGMQYYFPGSTYEMCIMDLAQIMKLHLPRFWNSMPYIERLRISATRFYFDQCCKIPAFRSVMNYRLKQVLEKAKNFDTDKHKELEQKSTKTLNEYASKTKPKDEFEKYSRIDYIAQI